MDNREWKTLYQAGAVAPLMVLLFYLIEFCILFVGDPYPDTIEAWYGLFQRSKLLGLWYLNALDIVSFALLGVMFLALYRALERVQPSWMLIALYVALLGVAVFIVPRALHLSLIPLSDLHAAATSDSQAALYLAAGEALSQVSTATPQTLGFLFMAVAGLIISAVILRGQSVVEAGRFGRAVGYVGITGFVVALANYASWLLALDVAEKLLPLNGLLWLLWWLLASAGLFRLSRTASNAQLASAPR
jgi:hypothetical protein